MLTFCCRRSRCDAERHEVSAERARRRIAFAHCGRPCHTGPVACVDGTNNVVRAVRHQKGRKVLDEKPFFRVAEIVIPSRA